MHLLSVNTWTLHFNQFMEFEIWEEEEGGEAEYHKLVKYDCYMGL